MLKRPENTDFFSYIWYTGNAHAQSAKSNGVCLATVANTVAKYMNGGVGAVTEFKRNINSDNARRKVDGRIEAML